MLKSLNRLVWWMVCWMAADLVLLIVFNPDETSHPFAISMFIGAVAYFFADWMEDVTKWVMNKVRGKNDNTPKE